MHAITYEYNLDHDLINIMSFMSIYLVIKAQLQILTKYIRNTKLSLLFISCYRYPLKYL